MVGYIQKQTSQIRVISSWNQSLSPAELWDIITTATDEIYDRTLGSCGLKEELGGGYSGLDSKATMQGASLGIT